MFSNQQLKESRVVALTTPRVLLLVAFMAAATLLVGCQSSPAEETPPAAAPAPSGAAEANSDPMKALVESMQGDATKK